MFAVRGSMSAKTGFAPANAMQFADERNVIGEVIASSPGPSPAASAAMCSAAVPFATATQYVAPVRRQIASSNRTAAGPVVM